MDKDFIPKFSDIENDYRERLKNDVSKYLPNKEEAKKDSNPEEIKNSKLTLDEFNSSGKDNKEKWLNKPNFLGLTRLEGLLIILILVMGIGFYSWYNLGKDGYLSSTFNDNSTCIANNITIPEYPDCNCPAAPACSLTCPVQNINITISNHS